MTGEEWSRVPLAHDYEVSNLGRLRSWRGGRTTPHLMTGSPDKDGYLLVSITDDAGRRRTPRLHLLVASTFLGERPDGFVTRHLDGNNVNNRPSNLAYGSPSENLNDQVRHGAHAFASRTACPQGHPYNDANTYHYRGARQCQECRRDHRALRTFSEVAP